jgi:uncharacterized protein (DUF2384 family)
MALRTSGIARRLEEISDRTGVKDVEVAQLLGTTPQSINRWRRSAVEPQTAHVHRILELTYVAELLSELYEPEDARLWLFSRHRLLDDRRPVDLIAAGDTESVLRVLSQLRDSAYV